MADITVSRVSKRYGDNLAVDDLSFEVQSGEIVGLLGANGAGKTTTMRMLLGLEKPSSGSMTMFGQHVQKVDRRRIGYVPQGLGLYSELTVAENLGFVAASFGVEMPDLGVAGLTEVADRQIRSVSLGIRRRTAFLAARCHEPEVLILDEPTSGVGPLGRARLWETIHEEADNGAAVLVSTHYMDEAEECERVVLMAGGQEVLSGTVSEILAKHTVVEVKGNLASDGLRALADAGGTVLAAGEGWRVVGLPEAEVRSSVGDSAQVASVPAEFEEVFVSVST